MILRIAGIQHFDVTARERLVGWLRSCGSEFGAPEYVAVEHRQDIFDEIKRQRTEFRRMLTSRWPLLSPSVVEKMTMSLGYEGDAHSEVFPDVEVLWLDEEREASENLIRDYAKGRLELYQSYLPNRVAEMDDAAVLRALRQADAAILDARLPPVRGCERDLKFAEVILKRIAMGGTGWGCIIVGKSHARRYPKSMVDILENNGQICKPHLL